MTDNTDNSQARLRAARVETLKRAIALGESEEENVELRERESLQALRDELKLLEEWKPEPPPPAELMADLRMRSYFESAIYDHPLQGAAAELQQEMGLDKVQLPPDLAGGTIIPLWGLADRTREVRERAAVAVTTGDYSTNVRGVLGQIFAGHDADFLGIRIEVVPGGQARYPVISGLGDPEYKAKGTAGTERDGTVTVTKLSPSRITSFLTINAVDNDMDWSALEQAMTNTQRSSLLEKMGNGLINGSGTAPQPQGILAGVATIADATSEATFDTYIDTISDGIDGKLATSEAGVRMLVGAPTYKHMRKKRQGTTGQDAVSAIRERGAALQVSAHIPAVASKDQMAIRITDPQAVVMPVWSYYVLIRDPYTKAENNQVRLVAHGFFSVKVLRQTGVVGIDFQVEA